MEWHLLFGQTDQQFAMTKKLFLSIFLISMAIPNAYGQEKAASDTTKAVADTTQKPTDYSKIVEEADSSAKGLMNIYYKDQKLYLEVPFGLMGRDMLLASTISRISDPRLGTVGAKPHDPLWIQFNRVDSVLVLQKMHQNAITEEGNPQIRQALQKNSIGPIIRKFDIEAYNDDRTTALIEVTDYFASDVEELSPFGLGMTVASQMSRNTSFKQGRSFIGGFKAFEDNITIKSHLSYEYTLKREGRVIEEDRPFTAVMTRTLLLLPEEPMKPRYADPRVGIFTTRKNKYSSFDKVEPVYYARRFQLVPKDPEAYREGELVEPREPITFYVDSDFPAGWKPVIKEAIRDWNEAFGRIGFKHAIRALDYPKNNPAFDPDNLKYNVIRYSPTPVQNAMGPSWIDPRSGEILNASVYVYHDIVKLINHWRFIQTAPADPRARSVELPEPYQKEGLRYVIRHEIGHTLGFRHNMAGSYAIPVDSLRSPTFTQQYGTTYSIMDYARFNYVAQPGDKARGVQLTPPQFGLYDYYLMKWNYQYFPGHSPEEIEQKLETLVDKKAGDDRYRYGAQGVYLDPSSQTEDLSHNVVEASRLGIRNLKYVMEHLNEWVGREDEDYSYRQRIWNGIVLQYVRYIRHVYAHVGGMYVNEKYVGDPRPHYRSVPREKQQQALKFLFRQLRNLDWLEQQAVIRNLPLTGDPSSVLRRLLTEAILSAPRQVDLSAQKSTEETPYDPREVVSDIYRFVWKATRRNKSLDETDRYLQKAFVQSVIDKSNVPEVGDGDGHSVAGLSRVAKPITAPDFVRDFFVEKYGLGLYEQWIAPSGLPQQSPVSATFGGPDLHFLSPPSLDSLYYQYLLKVQSLLKKVIPKTRDRVTKVHYELLLQNIKNALG